MPHRSLFGSPFPPCVQRGQGTREALAFFVNRQSSTFQKRGRDNDSLDYGLPGRGVKAPWRGNAFSSLCPSLQQSRVKVQPPLRHMDRFQGSGKRLPVPHKVKTSLALPWRCSLDWTARGEKKKTCKRTHSTLTHTHTLPSLVPRCTETLKSQLVLTLHIMSIVSKEKRFMELKHPQEVPPGGRRSCRWRGLVMTVREGSTDCPWAGPRALPRAVPRPSCLPDRSPHRYQGQSRGFRGKDR